MIQTKTKTLVECSILLSLGVALSFIIIWEMPMCGSITLASMLPILLVGIKYSPKWSFGCAFAYSLFQLLQAVMRGNVFVYCETWDVTVLCALLDYILPFSALGITAFAKKGKIYHYFTLAIAIRFVCHFLSGVLIWGQWAVNMSPTLYSLAYNGSFLLPELLITFAVTGPLFEMKVIRKLLNLPSST